MPPKVYHAHEAAYRAMNDKGISSWNERAGRPPIDADAERFFRDVLAQPLTPPAGRLLDVGCGTGTLTRWFAKRGWHCTGIDISPTAIRMARQLSKAFRIPYRVADAVEPPSAGTPRFDVVVDGFCLHCLITPVDRQNYLRNIHRFLKPGGVTIINTMARPVLPRIFKQRYGLIKDGIIYSPASAAAEYDGVITVGDRHYMPTRRLDHWHNLLVLLKRHGLYPYLFRVNACSEAEPISYLSVAAQKRPRTVPAPRSSRR